MPPRHFPPPWSAEVNPNCFMVRDADGQQLAYVYYESEPGRRSANCKCALEACHRSRSPRHAAKRRLQSHTTEALG